GSALLEELPRSGVKVLAAWTQSSGLAPPPLMDVDVVLLAVSDSAVAPLAARLEVGPAQLVAHLAGALGLDVLQAARKKGARIGEAIRAFRKATGASESAARAALLPLALGALEKLKGQTAAEALTGPAARGDLETIAAHRSALPKDLLPLYDHLTNVMLRL